MQKLSIGSRPGLSKDTRNDLGYGRTDANFHVPRVSVGTFPYTIDDNQLDSDLEPEDEELVRDIIRMTMSNPQQTDSLAGISVDHDSFVSGIHRIATLGESPSGKSMVPFPRMYSSRVQAGGGVNQPAAIRPGSALRTGTKKGWAASPVPIAADVKFKEIENGEPIELVKIRNAIKKIIAQENE
jgi:hypothetical protein